MELLFRLKHGLVRVLRLRTRGVKVMLFNPQGELLLVRHSYGRTDQYLLPGGGIHPFETPAAAAAREIREEVGVEVESLTALSIHFSRAEGKRDTVHLFTAFTAEKPVADGVEVEEARFFALKALPGSVSPATLRRIAEYTGERPVEQNW